MAHNASLVNVTQLQDSDLIRLYLVGAGLKESGLAGKTQKDSNSIFGELVRRHADTIRTHMRRMGALGHDADDMTQEAFLIAFERIDDFRHEGPFIGWLKMIASRRYLKKLKSSQKYLFVDDFTPFEADIADDEKHQDPSLGLDLDAALGRLKPIERLCISLNFSTGLSHQDIADELKMPLGTVKSHINRAMARLKAIMLSPNLSKDNDTKLANGLNPKTVINSVKAMNLKGIPT